MDHQLLKVIARSDPKSPLIIRVLSRNLQDIATIPPEFFQTIPSTYIHEYPGVSNSHIT